MSRCDDAEMMKTAFVVPPSGGVESNVIRAVDCECRRLKAELQTFYEEI